LCPENESFPSPGESSAATNAVAAHLRVSRSRSGCRPVRTSGLDVAMGSIGCPKPSTTTPSEFDHSECVETRLWATPGALTRAGDCDAECAHEGCGWRRSQYPGEAELGGFEKEVREGDVVDVVIGVSEESHDLTSELFRRSADRDTSSRSSASSSASNVHKVCHASDSTESKGAPAAARGELRVSMRRSD
jgi:hypothetical protein